MTLGEPARVEVFVNGQPTGSPFIAEELAITESRGELILHAKRRSFGAPSGSISGPTQTALDGFFGDVG